MWNKFINLLDIDSAVLYGTATRICSVLVGAITLLLLARYLSSTRLGYFYTFRSLLALQVFFELGLTTGLSTFFSHEFTQIHWHVSGELMGNELSKKRCWDIFGQSVRLFTWLSLGFLVCMIIVGFAFFSQSYHIIGWKMPWVVSVLCTAIFLYFTPHMAIIMGSGEVSIVYKLWFWGNVLGGMLACILIITGLGIYAVSTTSFGISLCIVWYLYKRKRYLLRLWPPIHVSSFAWSREIWPMQWRLAISWASGYFIYPLFVPVLFHYWGPIPAGRMGMTLVILNPTACPNTEKCMPKTQITKP